MKFSEMTSVEEIIKYQKQVLSRTGGRTSEMARFYHYTNITALINMLASGYIWLSSANRMNDILEGKILKACGIKNLNFACFSRTNQNIAMFKMYASNPGGVMMAISVADAKEMMKQKPRLVEEDKLTDEEVDTELYWTGVLYKDLETDKILTPDSVNTKIKKPLKLLAGGIKMSGWSYEKEVRLCASKRLYEDQRLAVKLPDNIHVVLCPGFDKTKYCNELAMLSMNGHHYESSVYDNWIDY